MKRKPADSPVMVLALLLAIIGLASALSNPTITGAAQTKTVSATPSIATACTLPCEPTYEGMRACVAESHQQETYGNPNAIACVNHCCVITPK